MSIRLSQLLLVFGLCGTLVTGCQTAQPTPFAATLPGIQVASVAVEDATNVPTVNATSLFVPTVSAVPMDVPTVAATITPAPTDTPNVTPPPTAAINPTEAVTATPGKVDHYVFGRPISRDNIDYLDRTYPYGSTQGGNRQEHLGVDFVNPRFTPVLAAADGEVIYAGSDSDKQIGPQTDYYGNVIVIQHTVAAIQGGVVYTLYGHLQRLEVTTGQQVHQGDEIGLIGDSGVAIGPHLHFEVRLGDPFSYQATRNPDLWIVPYPKFGTLAGRVVDADGKLAYGLTLQVRTPDKTRYAYTYADDVVNSDPVWGENFTLGDLPDGDYEVIVGESSGRIRFRGMTTIQSRRTTWIDVKLN